MAEKQHLGIYLTGAGAAVVLVEPGAKVPRLQSCFWVAKPAPGAEPPVTLADTVAKVCTERQYVYEHSALALDRCFYTQHRMHSQFREASRVADTVRYDAEEALTVDTTTLAVTFEILSSDESGSNLSIYAAEKKNLSLVLSELQAAGIDPLAFEPDSVALTRFLTAALPAQERQSVMYAIFSAGSCFLITFQPGMESPHIRTFITGSAGLTEMLAREIILTTASLKLSSPLSAIRVCDYKNRLDLALLTKRLSMKVEPFDLAAAAGFQPALLGADVEPLALAVACGAAMGDATGGRRADFRNDFAPHLGRKRLIDASVKVFSLSLAFIVLALGIYLQLRLFMVNRDRSALADKLAVDYRAVTQSKKIPSITEAAKELDKELRNVKEMKSGMLTAQGQETVTGLLTYVMEAINSLPPTVDLQVDDIKVTPKAVTLDGSTNKPQSTLDLFSRIGQHPHLTYTSVNQAFKNGRDEFGVTILPKKKQAGAPNAPKNK